MNMTCRLGILALLGCILTVGCRATTDHESLDRIVVSNMTHPPFSSWSAEGLPVGIEVDLVAHALSLRGETVTWTEHPFGELLERVASGRADIAAATIGVTAERAQRVAFTEPYFRTMIVALVRQGAQEPTTLEELEGRAVGVDPGTTAYPAARFKLPGAKLTTEPSNGANWGDMLRTRSIDAMIIDATDLERLQEQAGIPLQALPTALAEEHFALVVALDAPELLESLNRAVREYVARQPR
tara:strand:- start:19 stop:744 length:726 start_codon:yes stop_codon:yes gene_type:complete